MNKSIVISMTILALMLGACRRQEAVPMKLGVDVPSHSVSGQ